MVTYFISDLHLSDHSPHLNQLFTHFMEHILREGDCLYILGDLFEFWVGGDQRSSTQKKVEQLLAELKARHISWYFLAGNRDFLLGRDFLERTSGNLLPETKIITLMDQRVLLLHGDTLCTDDVAYQQWRTRVQKPWLQRLFLALPLRWRLHLAEKMRQKSMQQSDYLTEAMMDVNQKTVLKLFHETHTTVMIHGHVHRPGVATYWDSENQQWLTRYVLADWDSHGNYLRFDQGQFDLCFFNLE